MLQLCYELRLSYLELATVVVAWRSLTTAIVVMVAVLDHKRIIWFVMQWRWVVVALLHTVRQVESNKILGGGANW